MSNKRTQVEGTIRTFLSRAKKQKGIELDTSLYSEGLGLDSLETAELSATLEDELGSDPFTNGEMPQTVGDIVDYYERVETGS
ncbi:MAG: acyl carrier protein [Solirubrobacteraceae bacterium]